MFDRSEVRRTILARVLVAPKLLVLPGPGV